MLEKNRLTNFSGTNGCLMHVSFNHVVGWCDPEVKEGIFFSRGAEIPVDPGRTVARSENPGGGTRSPAVGIICPPG